MANKKRIAFYCVILLPVFTLCAPTSWPVVSHWATQGIAAGVATYAILCNHPAVTVWLHDSPIYYKDLENVHIPIGDPERHKFQRYWLIIQRFTIAIASAVSCVYYTDFIEHTTLNGFEILGCVGGFVSLLYRIVDPVGNLLLHVLNRVKIFSCTTSPITGPEHEPHDSQLVEIEL